MNHNPMQKAQLVATLMSYVVARNPGVEMTGKQVRELAESWAEFLLDRYTDGTDWAEQARFDKKEAEKKTGNIFM